MTAVGNRGLVLRGPLRDHVEHTSDLSYDGVWSWSVHLPLPCAMVEVLLAPLDIHRQTLPRPEAHREQALPPPHPGP